MCVWAICRALRGLQGADTGSCGQIGKPSSRDDVNFRTRPSWECQGWAEIHDPCEQESGADSVNPDSCGPPVCLGLGVQGPGWPSESGPFFEKHQDETDPSL